MKVLILYSPILDDAIFFTPVVRAMKAQLNPPEIHALLPAEIVFVAEDNPYLDRLVSYKTKMIPFLRKERYDVVVDCMDTLFSAFACLFTGVKRITYPRQNRQEWLMTRLGINNLPNIHISQRMLGVLKPLSIKPDELGLDYFIPERDRIPGNPVAIGWLPAAFRQGYVVFYISAPFATRRLPLGRMIELCDKINKPVLLLGRKEDNTEAERIGKFFQPGEQSEPFEHGLTELNKRTRIFNGVGRFNVNQMASLARHASRVFTFDSEMVAIASAFLRPVTIIMGNTIPLFGRYPYKTKFTILEVTGLACRPCTAGGYAKCPRGHFKCMKKIVFDVG